MDDIELIEKTIQWLDDEMVRVCMAVKKVKSDQERKKLVQRALELSDRIAFEVNLVKRGPR